MRLLFTDQNSNFCSKHVRMHAQAVGVDSSGVREGGIKILKMLQAGLGVAILIVGISSQANGFNDQNPQNCRGDLQPTPASNVTIAPSGFASSSSKPHSVRLSWNASIPASNSPADAIQGYNVYRRDPRKRYEKINTKLIRGTSCVDYLVKTGHTYYYETKAVSATGAVSKPSAEVKAVIPSR